MKWIGLLQGLRTIFPNWVAMEGDTRQISVSVLTGVPSSISIFSTLSTLPEHNNQI